MQTINEANSLDQYKDHMKEYANEVNYRRSVPDDRDGLKLVARRIIQVMYMNLPCRMRSIKSSKVVGDVMGGYHPHGDSSIYGAVVNLSNWFDTNVPLIYSPSNMGSMQGESASAPRYTEVQLSEFACDILKDLSISKSVVDWTPTYDNAAMEATFLPVSVPLLLINGTFGIGLGMRAEIPCHNITEVLDATLRLIQDPTSPVVLIPEQCMSCEIIDTDWEAISTKGLGKYTVRGIIDIETAKDGTPLLIIKSTPDLVHFDDGSETSIKAKILDMVQPKKELSGMITKIDEDSSKNNMRVVIHIKKGCDPSYVREVIYKNTLMQKPFSVNFEVLHGLNIIRYNYQEYLNYFINHRIMTKYRLYSGKLKKYNTEYHQLEAYIKVLESNMIDEIIDMISRKNSKEDSEIIEFLIKKLNITDIQAKHIINVPLKKLTKPFLKEYKEKFKEDKKVIDDCMAKLTNESLIRTELYNEIKEIRDKYQMPRKCRIITKAELTGIPQGEFNIVITQNNYIRKLPLNANITAVRGDNPIKVIRGENTENILVFTSLGRVYKIPIHKIPVCDKNNPGIDLRILKITSSIVTVIYEPFIKDLVRKHTTERFYLCICTRMNQIKKIILDDLYNIPPSGLQYTKLNENDVVQDVILCSNLVDVIVYSRKKALRIPMQDIPIYKRNAIGVLAMNTDSTIDGLSVVTENVTDVVVVTSKGKFNRFNINGLQKSARNKAGNSVIKLGKDDNIVAIYGVNMSNSLHVTTNTVQTVIPVSDISLQSTLSSGIKLLNMKNDTILKVELI